MSGIQDLAKKGRNGDNTLMHVSQDEVAGLNALARETMGRNLTTNPDTGLPEAFLFAPFAAPLLAGGVGTALGIGGGALATGLTAGALGAAEAELRGMDDPLRRGLFSGLTAGAASGLGNALSGASEAGQAAGAGAGGTGPGMDAAIQGSGAGGGTATGFSVANQSAAQPSFSGTGPLSTLGQGTQAATQAPTASLAETSVAQMPGPPTAGGAPTTMSSVTPSASASAQFPSGSDFATTTPSSTTGSMTLNPQQAFQQSQYADIGQMGEGLQNVFRDEAARGQFMQQAKIPATAGFVGLGGQAQMRAQDEMKDRQEAADAESAAELKEAQDRIRANYAAVGRPMPTGFGGGPLFNQGGIVNLRRGGGIGAPGSDVGRGGGGRAGSGGSSGGGGGPGRDTPGAPDAADGRRGASMGPSGGSATGGSTAAVQQSPQLDPDKIRAAVISPMDDFGNALKDIASKTLAGRVIGALTHDSRGTGVEQLGPHGPGAPLSASERGIGRDGTSRAPNMGGNGDGGGGLQSLASAPAQTGPTLPLMAERQPTPNESKFLAALQQGAGNQAAMQQTGYGMAEGGQVPGYFMGGNINKIAEAAKAGDAPGGGGVISKVIRAIQGRDGSKQGSNTSESDPDFQRFLGELRRGAGNQEAMQQTGYGMAEGGYLDGGMLPGDGMSDDIPATIDGEQPAALSSNEFVIPADVVSHIGNGSSDAGAKELYAMMDRIREARTGKESQAPQVNMRKMMPK